MANHKFRELVSIAEDQCTLKEKSQNMWEKNSLVETTYYIINIKFGI